MDPLFFFWAVFAVLVSFVIYFDVTNSMLKDMSTQDKGDRPYSLARVQLAWWSVIVLSSFAAIVFTKGIPVLHDSTLKLLGISLLTTGAARLSDVSDKNKKKIKTLSQDSKSEGFWADILSDAQGVSIYRFQTVVFNLVFGVWFVLCVLYNLNSEPKVDWIMPDIKGNDLILLGLSSGAYAGLKTTENKEKKTK